MHAVVPMMEMVLDAATRLRQAGYTANFTATEDGCLRCDSCGADHDPTVMVIGEIVRYEGVSDPGDETILFALRSEDGPPGLYVTGFGSSASPADAAVLRRLP